MMTVWKFELPLKDEVSIEMPEGASPLCVQVQGNIPYIWALVDTEKPKVLRKFHVRGTGHNCNDLPVSNYLGTFQVFGGSLVFHVWTT